MLTQFVDALTQSYHTIDNERCTLILAGEVYDAVRSCGRLSGYVGPKESCDGHRRSPRRTGRNDIRKLLGIKPALTKSVSRGFKQLAPLDIVSLGVLTDCAWVHVFASAPYLAT